VVFQRVEGGEISDEPRSDGLIRKIANPEVLTTCLVLLEEVKDRIEQEGLGPEINEDDEDEPSDSNTRRFAHTLRVTL